MSRFLVEAMVQVLPHAAYTKISFISSNGDIAYHQKGLQPVYHQILSVKCVPADDALLLEYGDTQGNMLTADGVNVETEPTQEIGDVSESGSSQTNRPS